MIPFSRVLNNSLNNMYFFKFVEHYQVTLSHKLCEIPHLIQSSMSMSFTLLIYLFVVCSQYGKVEYDDPSKYTRYPCSSKTGNGIKGNWKSGSFAIFWKLFEHFQCNSEGARWHNRLLRHSQLARVQWETDHPPCHHGTQTWNPPILEASVVLKIQFFLIINWLSFMI